VSAPLGSFSTYGLLADSQFGGSYAGTYAGGSGGSWDATVNVDGAISATATGPFAGTGSVAYGGATTIARGGRHGVSAAGTWSSSSGQAGTWVGSKIN
jgi:hypothetical protein